MVLTIFSFARRLSVEGCASEELHTVTAIVAGSRFSAAVLRLVLQTPLDGVGARWPYLALR
eukprot:3313182-Lingulodinium_polyedra.AAC.1